MAAALVASAAAVVLLVIAPGLPWWIFPILWLIVGARVFQGLAKRRAVDQRSRRAGA